MERMNFSLPGDTAPPAFEPVLVGVVGSGNLEVLIEPAPGSAEATVAVSTSAVGFAPIWRAVIDDFQSRHRLAGVAITVNDMGATPAVVSLRLDQAAAQLQEAAQ